MIYVTKTTETVKKEHYVAPCIKCDSDNIKINEYDDKYGAISTAKCTGCKAEVRVNKGEIGVINDWNKKNDIAELLAEKTNLIAKTKEEIAQLRKLQRSRAKIKRLKL